MPSTQMIIAAKDMASHVFKDVRGSAMGLAATLISLKASFEGIVRFRETAGSFVSTAAEFESLAGSLETLVGSSEQAEAAVAWIENFTAKTPYELEQVSEGFRQLAAYGFDPTKYLKPLGNVASAMNKELSQAVEMFADAAVGEFERLKEFGVRASQQGDQVTFRWSQNGQQMVKHARKTQSGITEALGEIFSRFDGEMDKQSSRWKGMVSNMMDYWSKFKKWVMESGPFDIMKKSLRQLLQYLETEQGKLDFAKWAERTARTVVGAFQAMAKGAQLFGQGLDNLLFTLQAVKLGMAEIGLWATKLNPLGLIPGLQDANAMRVEGFEQAIREAKIAMADISIDRGESDAMFEKVFAVLDKAMGQVNERSQLAGKQAGKFEFGGGSGGTTEDGPTKAQTKANENRLKLAEDFSKKIAKLNMNQFEYARWSLDLEVKAYKDKIAKTLDAEKLSKEERLKVETGLLASLEKYKADSLSKIAQGQKEHNAKLAKDLAEKNKKQIEEMKAAAREALAASDDMMAGLALGFAEFNDGQVAMGRATADIVKQNMEGSTESIRSLLHGAKVEYSSIIDSIIADFERMGIRQMITQPLSGGFSSLVSGLMSGGFSFPGFDSGGISYGPQLAWVSEGNYNAEAHVPLPDGRTIPVTMTGGAPSVSIQQKVIVNNNASDKVQVSQQRDDAGNLTLTVDAIAQDIASGGNTARAIQSRFNVTEAR